MIELDYTLNFCYDMLFNIAEWYYGTDAGIRSLLLCVPVYDIELDKTCEYYNLGILKVVIDKKYNISILDILQKNTKGILYDFDVYADMKLLSWKYINNMFRGFGWDRLHIVTDDMVKGIDMELEYQYKVKINFEIDISKYKFKDMVGHGHMLLHYIDYVRIRENEPTIRLDDIMTAFKVDLDTLTEETLLQYADFMNYIHSLYHRKKGIGLFESKGSSLNINSVLLSCRISFLNGYVEEGFEFLEKLYKRIDYAHYDSLITDFIHKRVMLRIYMYGDARNKLTDEESYDEILIIKKLRKCYKRLELVLVGDCYA